MACVRGFVASARYPSRQRAARGLPGTASAAESLERRTFLSGVVVGVTYDPWPPRLVTVGALQLIACHPADAALACGCTPVPAAYSCRTSVTRGAAAVAVCRSHCGRGASPPARAAEARST